MEPTDKEIVPTNTPKEPPSSQKRAPRGPRKTKALPSCFMSLTDKDAEKFTFVAELDNNQKSKTHNQEFMVVQSVTIEGVTYPMKDLTLDQMRGFAKHLGLTNCGSMTKFKILQSMATFLLYQKKNKEEGLLASSAWGKIPVNDRKGRIDHESKNINKAFWIRAAEAYNDYPLDAEPVEDFGLSSSDEEASKKGNDFLVIVSSGDEHLELLKLADDIDLANCHQLSTEAMKKKVVTLFKVRLHMKKNMTKSGTHDSDAWNFIEEAMRGQTGLTKDSIYYFWTMCEQNVEIDASFQPFMSAGLKGSSISLIEDAEGTDLSFDEDSFAANSAKKPKREQTMSLIMEQGKTMMDFLQSAHQDRQRSLNLQERATDLMAEIEIAKALGDTDKLKSLMEELHKKRKANL